MEAVIIAGLGLLGVSLGSFANAAVWRLHERRDIVHERSECPKCHHGLAWYDLIPVFSWLFLRGKCRYCDTSISWQYPAVELATTLYFIGSYLLWPLPLGTLAEVVALVLWLAYGLGLAILFVYDLRYYMLPDRIVFPLIGLAAIAFVAREAIATPFEPLTFMLQLAFSLTPIAGFYYLLYKVSGGTWVGFGDVKLGVFMGLALGWELALLSLVLANMLGFLVMVPGLAIGRIKKTSKVPFGPFLIAAFIISGLWGMAVIEWYLSAQWLVPVL